MSGIRRRPLEPAGSIPERLRIQAVYCKQIGSHLYANLLGHAAADFEGNGPTAAALRGEEPDLAALYADAERDPEAA